MSRVSSLDSAKAQASVGGGGFQPRHPRRAMRYSGKSWGGLVKDLAMRQTVSNGGHG
jgi:hypothetical protein